MQPSSHMLVAWQCASSVSRAVTSLLASTSAPSSWWAQQPHDARLAHARHASSTDGSHSPRRLSQQGPSDEYYRTPPEAYAAPQSEGQRRLSSRMEAILSDTLSSNASFRDALVDPFGLCIHRARLSPDRRMLSVLWECYPNKADACAQRLERLAPRLQAALAMRLRMARAPSLSFERDMLGPEQARAARMLEDIERERAADAGGGGVATTGGGGSSGVGGGAAQRHGADAEKWHALAGGAVDALRARMRARPSRDAEGSSSSSGDGAEGDSVDYAEGGVDDKGNDAEGGGDGPAQGGGAGGRRGVSPTAEALQVVR